MQNQRTVLLTTCGAVFALLPISVAAVGATGSAQDRHARLSNAAAVSPGEGSPTQVFAVNFTTSRPVTGNNWYLVEVKAPSKKRSCEYYESVQVSNAAGGQPASVELRPYDRRRWCAGRYAGAVRYQKRISCNAPDTDENFCGTAGSVTARFHFRVR
jgi:hypothetical protein